MNGVGILKEIRRRVGDVDGILDVANVDQSDEFWFEYIDGAVNHLTATDVISTTTYVVSGTTITPEPSTIDGVLFALWSVHTYLDGTLAGQIDNGDLGIRFKSGQDEISTVEASRRIGETTAKTAKNLREMINQKVADKANTSLRVQ